MQIFWRTSTTATSGSPLEQGAVHLPAAPHFPYRGFSVHVRGAGFWGLLRSRFQSSIRKHFCETVQRERVTHTVLVPTMINLLTQFPDLQEV